MSFVSLSEDIVEAVAVLTRGVESVRAVMQQEENRFSRALAALDRLARDQGIPIAIVGGLGAIRYGYPAATQDIDVVVAKDDLERLLQFAYAFGFRILWCPPSGWHALTHGDVEVNIVPEGGKARDTAPTTIPGPAALGVASGLGYANLSGWIELKVSSGRQKDRAHVVEVLKLASPADADVVRQHLTTVHASYLSLYDELATQAQQELVEERKRGRA